MIVVAFLFPLALYCFVLGAINRRSRPLMIPATWDFAGLLFAVSGFLIFSFPAMLSGFSERWRMLWLVGQVQGLQGSPDRGEDTWMILSAAYFLIVVGVAAVALWRRRSQVAVYNVDTAAFDEVLRGILTSEGLNWSRSGNRFLLRRLGEAGVPADSAYLTVDLAPSLFHVTLGWEEGESEIRTTVEKELGRLLAEMETPENPVSGWQLTVSTVLMLATLVTMTALAVLRIYGH